MTLGSSAELLQLEEALTSGKILDNLEIEAYHVGGDGKQLVDQFVFQDVLVTSLQTTNSVTNQVTVDFAQFSRAHVELNAKGGIGETTEGLSGSASPTRRMPSAARMLTMPGASPQSGITVRPLAWASGSSFFC